jgi:uncharacterized surface protein with fasciclin (FAS1) repeats
MMMPARLVVAVALALAVTSYHPVTAQGGTLAAEIEVRSLNITDMDTTTDTEDTNSTTTNSSYDPQQSVAMFRDALQAVDMLDTLLGDTTLTYTIFAPTDAAVLASPELQLYLTGLTDEGGPRWKYNLIAALRQHIVPDVKLDATSIFDFQVTELVSLQDPIAVSQFERSVQGASITEADVPALNGILHVVNKVLRPKFFDESFAQLELQSELGPDDLGRVALTDVIDLLGTRDSLTVVSPEGTTFVGCRIRAFNRLEEYLPQTINGSPDGVINGEFLNETFKTETQRNFIEYSLIPKLYYNEDIEEGFTELTVPLPQCGHMWVTKRSGNLCFNNGCVVQDPDPREYIASNGYVCSEARTKPDTPMHA